MGPSLRTHSKWGSGRSSMCRSRSVFFKINRWAGEKRALPCAHPSHPRTSTPPWMGALHFVFCKNGCQRTGGLNGNKKDMCQLESSSDRIGRSSKVHPWILKATLFFKFFLLRSTPRERVFYDVFRI